MLKKLLPYTDTSLPSCPEKPWELYSFYFRMPHTESLRSSCGTGTNSLMIWFIWILWTESIFCQGINSISQTERERATTSVLLLFAHSVKDAEAEYSTRIRGSMQQDFLSPFKTVVSLSMIYLVAYIMQMSCNQFKRQCFINLQSYHWCDILHEWYW